MTSKYDTPVQAPMAQEMALEPDARSVHVASLDTSSGTCFCCTSGLATCLWCFTGAAFIAPCSACKVLPPRTEAVGLVYGQYSGTWKEPGLYCVNPCGLDWLTVSVNNVAHEMQSMKCADSAGNSLLVSGVVTYRVVDASKAILDMQNLDQYVLNQAQVVLKRSCAQYRYITYDGSPSLMSEQAHLGETLRSSLQAVCDCAGVEVISFSISDLSYAPEIASQMLVRQQAQATVDARKMIVSGAVGIACDALSELAERGKPIPPADQSKFVSNLVMVICGEARPIPTITV